MPSVKPLSMASAFLQHMRSSGFLDDVFAASILKTPVHLPSHPAIADGRIKHPRAVKTAVCRLVSACRAATLN